MEKDTCRDLIAPKLAPPGGRRLLDRYAAHGLEDITSPEVFDVEPLRALEIARELGGPAALTSGGTRPEDGCTQHGLWLLVIALDIETKDSIEFDDAVLFPSCRDRVKAFAVRSWRWRSTRPATSRLPRRWRSATATRRRSITLTTATGCVSTVGSSGCRSGPRVPKAPTCAGLWSRGRGALSHESALAVHDLADVNPSRIHLTVDPAFSGEVDAVVLHRAELAESDLERRGAWAVTTVERTLLDVAGSDLSQEHVDAAVAEAISRGLATRRRLRLPPVGHPTGRL